MLAACNPTPIPTGPYSSAEEKAIMEPLIASLRPEDRGTVVYVRADGKVFSNKAEWRGQGMKAQGLSESPDLVVQQLTAPPAGFPAFEPRPDAGLRGQGIAVNLRCNRSDGPFHRVNTLDGTAKTPYSFVGANVTLPHTSMINLQTYAGDLGNEAAFVYFGGWGSGVGSAVDAGFVYSPVTKTWTQFMMVQGNKTYITVSYAKSTQTRLQSGTLPTQFYVPLDGKIALASTATFTNGRTERHTVIADAPSWQANGTGNIIKFASSLTQSRGLDFANGSRMRGAQFAALKTGTAAAPRDWQTSDSMVYALDADNNPLNKPACSFPNDPTRVVVDVPNATTQTVTIDLHP